MLNNLELSTGENPSGVSLRKKSVLILTKTPAVLSVLLRPKHSFVTVLLFATNLRSILDLHRGTDVLAPYFRFKIRVLSLAAGDLLDWARGQIVRETNGVESGRSTTAPSG